MEMWLNLQGGIESGPTFDGGFEEDDFELTGTALHDMNWLHPKKPGLGLWVSLDNCIIGASYVGSAMSPFYSSSAWTISIPGNGCASE